MKAVKGQPTTKLLATFPGHYPRPNIPPNGFSALHTDAEHKQWLEQKALEIFTEMANKRRPFADCLAAILLTGMNWGQNAAQDFSGDDD